MIKSLSSAPILYIIVPCYNEEEVLQETSSQLKIKLCTLIDNKKISKQSKVLFVNDGSTDLTWDIISQLHAENTFFSGINLTRNKGHQNALLAGLMYSKDICDISISIDADLQDDISAIDEMIEKYKEGSEIVYGVRSSRKEDTLFKRFTAEFFYKLMKVLGCEIIFNHADYRLMSKNALNGLSKFKEVNMFLRGIVPLVGYDYATVLYKRNKRFAGVSKYPLRKMLTFACEGITSMSIMPIRYITLTGVFVLLFSIGMLVYSLIRWSRDEVVAGWTSLIGSIWFLGGLTITSIGVIGEYIGKIYLEAKHRPHYLIKEVKDTNYKEN